LLEIFQAIPALLLGLLVLAALGPGVWNLVGVIALLNLPIYTRLIRAELLSRRRSTLVDAARISGVSWPRLLTLYVLPSSLTSALAYVPSQAGFAVILVAGLGFLGLGVPLPQAELGDMIRQGAADLLTGVWWTGLFPSLALMAATLSFYRLGDRLLQLAGLDTGARELADVR
jgi:peptide/nickel transport system permease protein